MLTIYQTKYEEVPDKGLIKQLISELPKQLIERANRFKFDKDAYNFVQGRLLLKKGLKNLGMDEQFDKISYQKNGKPILEGIFFNISHTENLIVCALSTEGEVGIDVEKVNTIELTDFKPWFTKNERTEINNASSPIEKFYWYWTRKESIIKALGINLSNLHLIEVDASKDYIINKGKKWYLKSLNLGVGYIGALCSEYPITNLKIE